MIIRGDKYPELWGNNKLIGYFVGENPVVFEAKEPITFDLAIEMVEFLAHGEFSWMHDQVHGLNSDLDWWDVSNDKFGGKTPKQQYEEDPKPLYDMIYILQSGRPM